MENDDLDLAYFINRPERRFRLREASAQEAERIGCSEAQCIVLKGGGQIVFKSASARRATLTRVAADS